MAQPTIKIEGTNVWCCICSEIKPQEDFEPVSFEPDMIWNVCQDCAAREKLAGVEY